MIELLPKDEEQEIVLSFFFLFSSLLRLSNYSVCKNIFLFKKKKNNSFPHSSSFHEESERGTHGARMTLVKVMLPCHD